jgi:hypothetical protein
MKRIGVFNATILCTHQVKMSRAQSVLPFKLATTDESLTAHAGLAVFGEFLQGMGICHVINAELPEPGSKRGYKPSAFVLPLLLMLHGGGRTLEDVREIRSDKGLLTLLQMPDVLPSSDATGNWLRRTGKDALDALQRVNKAVTRRLVRWDRTTNYTLDIDATQIIAEKYEAKYTYKGEKGYMPMVGHLAENGMVIGHAFREGNAAPSSENLEFIQSCEQQLPKGRTIQAIRADSASYQAEIINWCEETKKTFAIGAKQDAAVQALIKMIPEKAWTRFQDGEIAETVHCMNETKNAFRLIVKRTPQNQDLFDEAVAPYRYHAIASNREIQSEDKKTGESAAETMQWYAKRGDASENRIKDLKVGFSMEHMPCGTFSANAAFFALGVMAYNLFVGFRALVLGKDFARSQIQTVRWKLYQTAGKIVRHGRNIILKVSGSAFTLFTNLREQCAKLAQEGGLQPETS